ncbi:glycosyltransferase [candidate division KSB1 bacterium]|nr:glycosyltransferase [candidate division KSB1 bacterium]
MNFLVIFYISVTIFYTVTLIYFFVGMFFPQKGKNKQQNGVSIIIAARNEEKNIGNILTDLIDQNWPDSLYEIIIADDESTDKTAEIVREFSQKCQNIQLVQIHKVPPGFSPKKYALQQAVTKARHEIILSTDADCRVGPHWIESMVSYFTPDVGFVAGFSQFGTPGSKQNFLERLQAFDFVQLMGANAATFNWGHPLAASGQNLGYRKTAYDKIGGYRKISHRISGDDILFLQLVRKKTTYKLAFASYPPAYVVSKPQKNLIGLFNQRIRWASNGSYQIKLNIPFFLYLVLVFTFNFLSLLVVPLAFVYNDSIKIVILCLLCKAMSEFLVAVKSTFYFNRTDLLRFFVPWFLLQMPYVLFTGLLGSLGTFSWKDRKHTAAIRK